MPRSATHSQRRRATGRLALAAVALGLAGGVLLASPAAEARGFVGLSLGLPLGGPAYPAYYPPPPYYSYPPPPPVYSGPPPVAYALPPPAYAPSAPTPDGTCREYQSTATIDGRPQQTYGIACRQPDGTWRIVQ